MVADSEGVSRSTGTAGGPADASRAEPMARGSAPGKAILMGEHFVVHGTPALAVPLPGLQLTAELHPVEVARGRESARDGEREPEPEPEPGAAPAPAPESGPGPEPESGPEPDPDPAAHVGFCVRAALAELGSPDRDARAIIRSSIPVGSGMGSSAALSVAIARAAEDLLSLPRDADRERRLSMRCERRAHGRPSGVDTEVCVTGRPVWLESGRFEALESPGLRRVGLVALYCGEGGATAGMIARVDRFRAANRERFGQLTEQTIRRCRAAREALLAGEVERLGQGLTRQHRVLQEIGVSTDALDAAVQAALDAGAAGAKLSGAGGGGLAVAVIASESLEALVERLKAGGLTVMAASPLSPPE